jgi:hypothetical protein
MVDLSGQRFGRLIALSSFQKPNNNRYFWNCKCDCGETVIVASHHLRSGATKSCGCIKKEFLQENKFSKKHGFYLTKLYAVWDAMKQRCNNQNHKAYYRYGGRGIVICQDWYDFQNFHDWAMSHGYQEGLSIDRIDNNGNYCPSNCQWITRSANTIKSHLGQNHTNETKAKIGGCYGQQITYSGNYSIK